MAWEAWFTLLVVLLSFGLLAFKGHAPDVILLGALTTLLVSGVLTPEEALAGLSNEGMVTVGVLYVVVSGLRETGSIAWIAQHLLGRPKSLPEAQFKVMAPVAALSAFLNNTPVVAIFIPALRDWAKRNRLSVSKLMIPLSYAAIAGGTCTLIGTSTNLVVNGLLIEETELPGLGMFDLAWIGLPLVAGVILFVLGTSRWLLKERVPVISQFADVREYTVEMVVEPNSPLSGKSIEEAGLRQLPGLYLVEIERGGQAITAVSPHERLHDNDRLVFAGIVDSVIDLQKIRGLKPATNQLFKLDSPAEERTLVEAVLSDSSPLVGKSVREGRFRTRYDAAIIAVARNGQKIREKIGDIVLHPGDTLLLVTHPRFVEQQRNSRDFFLVSRLDDSRPPRHERASIAVAILGFMVFSAVSGWLSILEAAMLAAGLMIITRCTTASIARNAVDWQVLLVIAASFGLGTALETSGAAAAVAEALISLANGIPWLALGLVFIATALFSALATNNAAAVLMFPIALLTARQLEVELLPFAITIMIAASASFATPIGYQTNLMVFGAGGYRFSDYLRIGIPLTVFVGVLTTAAVPLIWPF